MATKQLTSLDAYVIPRVNLLPPEIGQRKAERRSYTFMGLAGVAAAGAVAAMYLGQASRVSSAKQDLQKAQGENTRLKAKRLEKQPIQDVYLQVSAQEGMLTRAYENRVLWSVYLHNVGLSVPENVWITQFAGKVGTPPASVPGNPTPGVGSMTFTGKAYAYNDVAAWLDSIAKVKGVTNAWFSTASTPTPTKTARTIVTFSSTATLTPAALKPHTPGSR